MTTNALQQGDAATPARDLTAYPAVLEMCRNLPQHQLAAGQILLREGERAGVLYFLIRGEVEILKQGIQIDRVSEPGSIFGEMSVLLNLPHMATVKAVIDSRFYAASSPDEFSRSHPDLYVHVSTLLAWRLHSVTNHLVETRLHQKFDPEHALAHRIMQALQTCLGTPVS